MKKKTLYHVTVLATVVGVGLHGYANRNQMENGVNKIRNQLGGVF